jgi:hypothetical protein
MEQANQFIQWQTLATEPIAIGDTTITLQARALSLHLPFGGFVWNQPATVLAERNGQLERIPINDVTRAILLALASATFALSVGVFFIRVVKQRRV